MITTALDPTVTPGWFNHGERILSLVEMYRPRVCVELGTWQGASAIPVALAIRRWSPMYNDAGAYVDALQSLYVVDLANPDSPQLGSTVVTSDPSGWWGNMRAIGTTLYTTHYEWQTRADGSGNEPGQLARPHGMAMDSQGYLYVCDAGNQRIQKFAVPGP